MELKDFVKESLVQIISAVTEAQKEIAIISTGEISPGIKSNREKSSQTFSTNGMPIQDVSFDIAVAASEKTGTKGTVGVVISVLKLGAQGESQESTSNNSRIKFTIPITLPQMKYNTN